MAELLSFLVVVSAGLFLSEIFRRFNMPYVVGLILAGVIIGPYGANFFQPNQTMEFLGSIGLVFLMFMAGLEIRLSSLRTMVKEVSRITFLNGAVPFVVGFLIASYFGYGFIASLFLGTIFVSSSIAVIIPSLEASGLINSKPGKTIVAATVFEDLLSLVILSVLIQSLQPTTNIPLPIYYVLMATSLIGLRGLIPKIRKFFLENVRGEKNIFEYELRLTFAILIGVVVFFEALGMHAIIAGFFTGLVLSESIKSEMLKKKLHAISYGLFIPVFFIIIGTGTDISVFTKTNEALLLTVVIVVGSVLSKYLSGWLGARISGFTNPESRLVGAATIPQLSTTLAVAFVALELKLFDQQLITAMIVLSAATTLIAPLLMAETTKKVSKNTYHYVQQKIG